MRSQLPRPRLRTRIVTGALLIVLGIVWLLTGPPTIPNYQATRARWVSSEARLLARDGRVLDIVRVDAASRRLDWVPLASIAAPLIAAAIHNEDRRFRDHRGIDWRAVAGAFRDRLTGRPARGASTITMQLAGLLSTDLGTSGRRSWRQKFAQARAAQAIESTWSKHQILEAWFNLLPWRGDLVGIDAAARSLAGHPTGNLSVAEAQVLAALIPSPAATPQRVAARACIAAPDCGAVRLAAERMLGPRTAPPDPNLASQLAAKLLRAGRREVRTTIDAELQAFVLQALTRRLGELGERNVRDGAAIVVDNGSGEILAYVGSVGAMSRSAQVDGAAAPRQAGSTLKPFLYGLAIERRLLTAASVLDDAPVDLDTASGLYIPQNYDRIFRGPVSARSALGNSLNVPAVRTLLLVGVDAFRDQLYDYGYHGISREGDYYGFSLALGSAEVTLAEQAAAYRSLARGGLWSALRVEPGPAPVQRRVLSAAAASIVADMLGDGAARTSTFGSDSTLGLPFWAAVKTGTSKALRDNWCIGFSDRFTVAVWVGNFEGDSMGSGVSGVSGGAPAWREIMLHLHRDRPGRPPVRDPGVTERRVTFVPAIEPPRTELFLPGTELDTVRVTAGVDDRPRLVAPTNGAVIALDPDIPPLRQRVGVRTSGATATMRLDVDGRPLGPAAAGALWLPIPGVHRFVLRDAAGKQLDAAQVSVR